MACAVVGYREIVTSVQFPTILQRILCIIQIVVGTKSGSLELYDVASSSLLESFPSAHDGPVWSVQVRPDGRGLVSGSADSNVKFWDFEVREVKSGEEVDGQQARAKVLTMIHSRTLKMTDDVLSVRYSPDGKLLAVSLLDSTVKVFFQDTLKFFLSLYGHKVRLIGDEHQRC